MEPCKKYEFSVTRNRLKKCIAQHLWDDNKALCIGIVFLVLYMKTPYVYLLCISICLIICSLWWLCLGVIHYIYDKKSTLEVDIEDKKFVFIHNDEIIRFSADDIDRMDIYTHVFNAVEVVVITLKDGTQINLYEWLGVLNFLRANKKVLALPLDLDDYLSFFFKYHINTIIATLKNQTPKIC